MGDRNARRISELVKRAGNNECADCGLENPEWASFNIGVFVCTTCASWHRSIGTHVSKIKSLTLDRWDDEQVEGMELMGNVKSKARYEAHRPACYRAPRTGDPPVLLEQWIRAKYERQEFINVDKQTYLENHLEGELMKKARVDNKYYLRKFILSDNSLKYYSQNGREVRATIPISDVNVCLAPQKMKHDTGMQLTYLCEGSTRHLFVYHDSGEDIIRWYNAIRNMKLNWLMVAYPSVSAEELVPYLTNDFVAEGWLSKTGPREGDAYRRRWFTLDDRKLMYHDNPMSPQEVMAEFQIASVTLHCCTLNENSEYKDAYPKGEIFLGHKDNQYSVQEGVPRGHKEQDFPFSLYTPNRNFVLSAATSEDRARWLSAIGAVLERAMRPQDNQSKADMEAAQSNRKSSRSSRILSWL